MSETEEGRIFLDEMADVRPLKKTGRYQLNHFTSPTPGQQYRRQATERAEDQPDQALSLYLKKLLKSDDWLEFKRDGIQEGVFKKFRQGRYSVDATLDLQLFSPEMALKELPAFIDNCIAQKIRCLLICHGRKRGGKSSHALIKSYLAQWLPRIEPVMAFHTAQTHHGGTAAVYVLLRKSEKVKEKNRERHETKRAC